MTTFDDREKGFENKFAHDQEMAFRITARRNRLVGEWAAKQGIEVDVEELEKRLGVPVSEMGADQPQPWVVLRCMTTLLPLTQPAHVDHVLSLLW